MAMRVRGVRGATTVTADTEAEILSATTELLREIIHANGIVEDDVASVFFTTTPDLTAVFPAQAARSMGWTRVALIGSQEMSVPDGLAMAIRILIHWNTEKALDDIRHVYMHGAERLRPDLYPKNKIVLNGGPEK